MNTTGIWDLNEAKQQHHYSPRLAKALEQVLPKETLVSDFGCGKGSYIAYLQSKGYTCAGYEGTPNIEDISDFHPIHPINLTKPFTTFIGNTICLEVAEHIPKNYEHFLISNLWYNTKDILVVSWAVQGQGGHGHVNEQNSDYVLRLFNKMEMAYDEKSTKFLRKEGGSDLWWFANSIYVFTK